MSSSWITIAGLAVATFLIKGFGPVAVGGRRLPDWATRLISLAAPALLGAFVAVETLGREKDLVIDARLAGVAVAAAVLAARLSIVWAGIAAAAVAALVRAIG